MAGLTEPSNKILIAGNPIVVEYKDASSGAILPGDLVYMSGVNKIDEGGVAIGTEGLAIGVAGYEQANDEYKPDDTDTAYASGSMIPVILSGSGCIVRGTMAAGVFNVHAALTASGAGTGNFTTGTIGTNHIYGILMETSALTASADDLAMILLL